MDNYWDSYGSWGPDPWERNGDAEHSWESVADFMGTSQWKWDFIGGDGKTDFNFDGSTALWTNDSGAKLYDYVPSVSEGVPGTALSHGMHLFAESRGYSVVENYTQNIDGLYAGGFSFADYMAEIDGGFPVMIQLAGHSMTGVGYNAADGVVYFHDTWDNSVHSMSWGGSYGGMEQIAMTVIHLGGLPQSIPEPSTIGLLSFGVLMLRRKKER